MGEVEGQVVEDDERRDAEDEARRRVALAQIRQYPDVALRMKAKDVTEFDEFLVQLVERMMDLMHDAHGAGLAANQIGVLRRIFVFTDGDTDHVVVNPSLVERSKSLETDDEGCLSLGPIRVPVERSAEVTLAGQDLTGAPIRMELDDLQARVVQHELDHLDGVLMLERTDDASRRGALGKLRPQPVLGIR